MPQLKLSKILWSILILFIIATIIVFSVGVLLVGAAVVSLITAYYYYFGSKRSKKVKRQPSQEYMFGEVIDIKAEVVDKQFQIR